MSIAGVAIACATGCGNGDGQGHNAEVAGTGTATATASVSVKKAPQPPPEVAGPAPVSIPVEAAKVLEVVNPKGVAPYAGPIGAVIGRVSYAGDPPPDGASNIPAKCAEAAATFGKRFRVGQDKALADTLVTVTNYDAFVPAKGFSVAVPIHGCAPDKRTVVATFGQHVEVSNKDTTDSYMLYLDGAPTIAIMVAIPQGAPVKLYPTQPGHYLIRDQLPKPFLVEDLFVLKFATHDVTGLDGRFRIEGVPVGKVRVDAFLPALDKSVGKEIDVKEGDNTVDFELTYDKDHDRLPGAPPAPSGSASAGAAKKKPHP